MVAKYPSKIRTKNFLSSLSVQSTWCEVAAVNPRNFIGFVRRRRCCLAETFRTLLAQGLSRLENYWSIQWRASPGAIPKSRKRVWFGIHWPIHGQQRAQSYLARYGSSMRSRGVTCTLCGLSANDMEREFKEAGADQFMLKPLPFERQTLQKSLLQVTTTM